MRDVLVGVVHVVVKLGNQNDCAENKPKIKLDGKRSEMCKIVFILMASLKSD